MGDGIKIFIFDKFVYHFWSGVNVGTGYDLNDIRCAGDGDIIAVGDGGTIIQATARTKGKGKDQGKGKK